jgi:hypothetical protein
LEGGGQGGGGGGEKGGGRDWDGRGGWLGGEESGEVVETNAEGKKHSTLDTSY